MADPAYLAKLETGNIGVAQGDKSNGLCSIDLDRDEDVEPFLQVNDVLRYTLRTKGNRGCNIWVKVQGPYPRSQKLKLKSGPKGTCGEWRANGNQTIIDGTHKDTGEPYQILQHSRPMPVHFSSIKWPDFIKPLDLEADSTLILELKQAYTEKQETEETEKLRKQETEDVCVAPRGVVVDPPAIEGDPIHELILRHELVKPKSTNDKQFAFIRSCKSIENYRLEKFTPFQKREIFDRWYVHNKQFLNPAQSISVYFSEFLNRWEKAQFAEGEDGLTIALERALVEPLPPEAAIYKGDKQGELLVAICWQLHLLRNGAPFYVPCRRAGMALGVCYKTAATLLKGLVNLGILEPDIQLWRQDMSKAMRYRYISGEGAKVGVL